MTNFPKIAMAVIVAGLIGFAFWGYFWGQPPTEGPTIYGFLRFTGPLVGALAALLIALAGNWANDRRLQDERTRKADAERAKVEEVRRGLQRELDINQCVVRDMLRNLENTGKLLEGNNVNLDSYRQEVRKFIEQNWAFEIKRPVYERLGSAISDQPHFVILAIVNNESRLQFLQARLKECFDIADWRRVHFVEHTDKLVAILQDVISVLNAYSGAMIPPEER